MELETSDAIELFFPKSSFTLVYFEALANALDAKATDVTIEIDIESFEKPETLTLTISDNGEGFTDENFERFKKLRKPRDKFHKGIGRVVFLKYFERVDIESKLGEKKRIFTFNKDFKGTAPIQIASTEQTNKTTLSFSKFANEKINSYDDLKPDALKPQIIEKFLPTLNELRRNEVEFKIAIKLHTNQSNYQQDFFPDEASITSADLPEMTKITIQDDLLDIVSDINIYYHIKPVSGKGRQLIAFSIDGRTIPTNLILSSSFPLGYFCVFLFESKMFHTNADSSRQKLVLPEGTNEPHLYHMLRNETGKVLSQNIPKITEKNKETKKNYEEKFPHLLGYFEENTVGLIDRDEALSIAQQKFFRVQKEVLQCETLSDSIYEKSLELSSRTLTEYILYRNKIINRMKEIDWDNPEADIHNLIVPRFREFNQDAMPSEIYQNNAWLLDDKFMAFRTILSEKRMDSVINAIRLNEESIGDEGRPDIAMIFSSDPARVELVDVVVVEIKKKTDDEMKNQFAINQLLDRAVKLVKYCPNIQRVWYYAVMQINDTMAIRLRQQKWAPLYSKGKYFIKSMKRRIQMEGLCQHLHLLCLMTQSLQMPNAEIIHS